MPLDGRLPQELLPAVTVHLMNARDRIANGWCRHTMHTSRWSLSGRRDHYCMVGAVALGHRAADAALYLAQAIDDLGFGFEQPARGRRLDKYEAALLKVMLCNDFDGRTQEDCVAILDRAVELSLEAAQ